MSKVICIQNMIVAMDHFSLPAHVHVHVIINIRFARCKKYIVETSKYLEFYIIIGIVEKYETCSDATHNGAITVLHEQGKCIGMQRHTNIIL